MERIETRREKYHPYSTITTKEENEPGRKRPFMQAFDKDEAK